MWGVGAGALQETWDLLKRRAGLTIKPTTEGKHHEPGFICSGGQLLALRENQCKVLSQPKSRNYWISMYQESLIIQGR